MKAIDFINQNRDICIAPITEAEFQDLTEGRVLFCVTTGSGHNPVMERQVRTAGYQALETMCSIFTEANPATIIGLLR